MTKKKDSLQNRIEQLEQLVQDIESGSDSLDVAIDKFETGAALAKEIKKDLTTQEQRLEKIYDQLSKEIFEDE